jgi:hypothetical protein
VTNPADVAGVERFLPPRAQHQLYQIDWGML